jgi:hypothetical protein
MSRAWPRTKGRPSWAQRSASQVPGEEAFDADDKLFAVGGDRLEKRLRCRFHLPVPQDLAGLVQEADVHGAGVPVNPAVTSVLWGVEAPEVSSSPSVVFPSPSSPMWYAEEGASISIEALQATAYSVRFASAFSRA